MRTTVKHRRKTRKTLTAAEIAAALENVVPVELQEEWDNSGLTIGLEDNPVSRILTCLEINDRVVKEATDRNADMIITHHPLIFGDVRTLRTGDDAGMTVIELIRAGISVYSCHTPFDKVKGGNNDVLAKLLGLTGVKNLKGEDVAAPDKMTAAHDEADIGRIGTLRRAASLKSVIKLTADSLGMSVRQLRAVGDLKTKIKTVAVCSGAGADFIPMAASSGCDLMITGDVKYHQAQDALKSGICVIDAGHYGTERAFGAAMKVMLDKELGGKVEIIVSETDTDPFILL